MSTAARLGLYAAGLAVVFGGAFTAADAVVPQSAVTRWDQAARGHQMSNDTVGNDTVGHETMSHGGASGPAAPDVHGVTSTAAGLRLTPVSAPAGVGTAGTLSFRVMDGDGAALTSFVTSHDKALHLIVVRSDGTRFRHVHPTLAADGTWSLPWTWEAAGTYRVYADFVPSAGAESVTLTRTVDVAGSFTPAPLELTDTATVAGFDVRLDGDVVAGSTSGLTFQVTRDGRPVTTLQPYLGAFGHLVALRDGDLAYLHVHPAGDEPRAGQQSGPEIAFAAEAPTPGRYLLYLDFQVDGRVHTAPFVVEARPAGLGGSHDSPSGDPHGH